MKRSSKQASARPTNPEWTDALIANARPARDVLPKIFGSRAAAAMLRQRGRRKSPSPEVSISLRLSGEHLARWKATGRVWQTRMANLLEDHIAAQVTHGRMGSAFGMLKARGRHLPADFDPATLLETKRGRTR